ncbi:hypothetical protein JHK86_055182 [Glycine max]|nr:hypothetical protein JHK86_055182 [Glycine max]
MEATFPSNWKNLTIEKYGGTIDPNEHLDVLITQVSLYTTDDEILCQVSHIMDQALAVNFLAMPKRANTPPKVDYSKCGRYHRNHGHSTKEYTTLKAKMEELIKLGHLKKLVHKP